MTTSKIPELDSLVDTYDFGAQNRQLRKALIMSELERRWTEDLADHLAAYLNEHRVAHTRALEDAKARTHRALDELEDWIECP